MRFKAMMVVLSAAAAAVLLLSCDKKKDDDDGNGTPVARWTKTFGGTGYDAGYAVQQTTDGGYVIAGETWSNGAGGDVWLIKTDGSGSQVWNKTYDDAGGDCGYSVQQTSDGGYIIVGGYIDAWLIKADASGDTVWTRTFGGTGYDAGYSVQQTTDGGYIIAGVTGSYGAGNWDVWLIKTDASGDTAWARTFGGTSEDQGNSVEQTSDGGYIIAGETQSYGAGGSDVWLVKTDASGNQVWAKTFGGTDWDYGSSVQQTSDGGYVIAGETQSYGAGGEDVWLIKTDANGDTAWARTYGGIYDDVGSSGQQTSDGGYIIAGATHSYGVGENDIWLIKTDASGDTAWTRVFGGAGDDWGESVRQTSDGGYIIAGHTGSYGAGDRDVWLIKTDANGDTLAP